ANPALILLRQIWAFLNLVLIVSTLSSIENGDQRMKVDLKPCMTVYLNCKALSIISIDGMCLTFNFDD
ncbi:MAG: hypothetical protein WBE52_10775, partial [Terriglobales bacterium]